MRRGEKVVLLHGILRGAGSLAKFERALRREGFRTLNVGYPSRRMALEELVGEVHRAVGGFVGQDDEPVHFVTHSMGGLLARAYIARHRPRALGRAVLLGPPNKGSECADLLVGTALYRKLFGPAGAQLTTQAAGRLHDVFGEIDYPLGVIAGDRSVDPVSTWLILPRPNDGRVSVASTAVDGMAAHLTLHVTHAFMMLNSSVIRQTVHFLRHGTFE